jgi:hypothetical protein
MSSGRPGGLTALAVMNFIFGAFGILQILAIAAMAAAYFAAPEDAKRGVDKGVKMILDLGLPAVIAFLSLAFLAAVLEVMAGFGYLRQKRFLGRVLGNAFALLSIAGNCIMVAASRGVEGMGVNLGALIGVLYPLLTLLLINTTFREDLVN